MIWYGSYKIKNLYQINYKRNFNFQSKKNKINLSLKIKINFNKFKVCFFFPQYFNFIIFNLKQDLIHIYIYSLQYYFYLIIIKKNTFLYLNNYINGVYILFKYRTNFYKMFINKFKIFFYNHIFIFFKKLKLKGKGYYIYKNFRNSIAPQFGYSHKVHVYSFYIYVKFLSKKSIILFGINKNDILSISFFLYNKKNTNIFTTKGIRFTRQIIYKKLGKISNYR